MSVTQWLSGKDVGLPCERLSDRIILDSTSWFFFTDFIEFSENHLEKTQLTPILFVE